MNPEEYARMHAFEDWYWWFVARRQVALTFARDYRPSLAPLGDARCPVPGAQMGKDPSLSRLAPGTGHRAPLAASSPLRVLDAGCGTGALMERLSQDPEEEVYGVDFSREALAFSHQRGQSRLVQGDLTALPFASDRFDMVTALDVVEHVERDVDALREICRVLRPGGVLLMSVPAYPFLWSSHDTALHHKRRYSAGMLAPRLAQAGLTIVKTTYLLAFLFPAIALFRVVDRLRRRERRPRAHLVSIPPAINRLLIGLQEAELSVARRLSLPFGVSLFCVARKEPAAPSS